MNPDGAAPANPAQFVARLMAKIVVTPTGCWEYVGQRDRKGYGRHSFGPRKALAHRVAWTLRHGDPGSLCVLHRCDNPPCIRPAHLFLGDRAINNADMRAKGRARNGGLAGERHGRARLTSQAVAEIRSAAATTPQRVLAEQYSVSQSTVWRAIHNRTWAAKRR